MSAPASYGAIAARARRTPSPGRGWMLVALLLLAALPRLWRFTSVGEGVDEAYSVTATRAMLDGHFSYRDLDDFAVDAYQAKFCPVAEAVAAPFVSLLGDRPLAFRLPSLFASLLLGALLVRFSARRLGPTAAWVTGALWALDYRGVVYAQTHRYVALEQLLAFLAFLAFDRADRTRRVGAAALALGIGLLLFHTHLLAVLTLGALALGSLAWALARRSGPLRPQVVLVPHALLFVHAALVFALFKVVGFTRFFEAGSASDALRRAVIGTARMVAGQGVVAGAFGVLGAIGLARGARTDRALALCALVPLVAFALGSLRLPLAPRYVLTAQPFLFVAAGAFVVRARDVVRAKGRSWGGHPRLEAALGVALLAATAAPTVVYLAGGGGRDLEVPIVEALRTHGRAGDRVLYDDALFDPFARRPAELPAVSRSLASDPDGERTLDALGVRFVVRSSAVPDRALYTPSVRARLEPVASSRADLMFQEPIVLTLYRVRAR
jgi:hypothetical protein